MSLPRRLFEIEWGCRYGRAGGGMMRRDTRPPHLPATRVAAAAAQHNQVPGRDALFCSDGMPIEGYAVQQPGRQHSSWVKSGTGFSKDSRTGLRADFKQGTLPRLSVSVKYCTEGSYSISSSVAAPPAKPPQRPWRPAPPMRRPPLGIAFSPTILSDLRGYLR